LLPVQDDKAPTEIATTDKNRVDLYKFFILKYMAAKLVNFESFV